MAGERKLDIKPRRRSAGDQPAKQKQAKARTSTPARQPVRAEREDVASEVRHEPRLRQPPRARRRVHVTVDEAVAAAVQARVAETRDSNTQVLIDAYTHHADGAKPEPQEQNGPFAPRGRVGRRHGVYFYLSIDELAHLDGAAEAAGFETRSAYVDTLLKAHLLS